MHEYEMLREDIEAIRDEVNRSQTSE
jgi:hypothetical protein